MSKWSSVPGILLKTNLFGDGERKNNQDRSNSDGKFAVSVPVGSGWTIRIMSHCCYHCNKDQELKTTFENDTQAERETVKESAVEMNCKHCRDLTK